MTLSCYSYPNPIEILSQNKSALVVIDQTEKSSFGLFISALVFCNPRVSGSNPGSAGPRKSIDAGILV